MNICFFHSNFFKEDPVVASLATLVSIAMTALDIVPNVLLVTILWETMPHHANSVLKAHIVLRILLDVTTAQWEPIAAQEPVFAKTVKQEHLEIIPPPPLAMSALKARTVLLVPSIVPNVLWVRLATLLGPQSVLLACLALTQMSLDLQPASLVLKDGIAM